jgi:hypothetical protein
MSDTNQLRSEKLRQQEFSFDQLDLLAGKIDHSVEMLQMMIDGVAEIGDTDAQLIEQILEKPKGYLDGASLPNEEENKPPVDTGQIAKPPVKLALSDSQTQIVTQFVALSEQKQKIVSDLISTLSDTCP